MTCRKCKDKGTIKRWQKIIICSCPIGKEKNEKFISQMDAIVNDNQKKSDKLSQKQKEQLRDYRKGQ